MLVDRLRSRPGEKRSGRRCCGVLVAEPAPELEVLAVRGFEWTVSTGDFAAYSDSHKEEKFSAGTDAQEVAHLPLDGYGIKDSNP